MRYKGKHFKKEKEKFGFKIEVEYFLHNIRMKIRKIFKNK